MLTMIVQHPIFVIRAAVLMLVDCLIVAQMPFVRLAFIRQNVFVYLDILEMLDLHVINVSQILQLVSSLDILIQEFQS